MALGLPINQSWQWVGKFEININIPKQTYETEIGRLYSNIICGYSIIMKANAQFTLHYRFQFNLYNFESLFKKKAKNTSNVLFTYSLVICRLCLQTGVVITFHQKLPKEDLCKNKSYMSQK